MNTSDFFKFLLGEDGHDKGLGYLEGPLDTRDISFADIEEPVATPSSYFTDISKIPILDQGRLGSCVGHAFANYINHFEILEGRKPEVSPRYIYGMCKKIDGHDGQGTYPRVAAAILKNMGAATTNFVPNNVRLSHEDYITLPEKDDAEGRKVLAYAFVPNTMEMIKQALVKHKFVAISMKLPQGRHYVLAYGYNKDHIYYINSWGKFWGNRGRGKLSIKDDLFDLRNIITLVDIDETKKKVLKKPTKWKYFASHEVYKLNHKLVDMLDEARGLAGIPFVITSGYRSPEYNKKVGGATNSAHLRGLAADIRCRNSSERHKIISAALKVGFNRIGIGDGFVHLDIDKSLPQNRMWTY